MAKQNQLRIATTVGKWDGNGCFCGQYTNYKVFIGVTDAERQLYLAITKAVFDKKFTIPGVQLVLQVAGIRVVTFDEVTETITSWEN